MNGLALLVAFLLAEAAALKVVVQNVGKGKRCQINEFLRRDTRSCPRKVA